MISSDSLLGFGFNHQHGAFRAGDHQVKLRALQLGSWSDTVHTGRRCNRRGRRRSGRLNGMPEIAIAADAPSIAGMSGSISGLHDITVQTTCTSL
jgi:hypothetical protein